MTTNVNKLIENAFKTAGLFTQDKRIEGSRVTEALDYLNELLDEFAAGPEYIAYYQDISFVMTPNQGQYVLSQAVAADVNSHRLVDLKYAVVETGGNRYPVDVIDDHEYFTIVYNTSITGRPSSVFLQNGIDILGNEQSTLMFLKAPDIAYTCHIKGKFVLSHVLLNTGITTLPKFYMKFLRYALAKELAMQFMPKNWTQYHEQTYSKLRSMLTAITDINVSSNLPEGLIGRNRHYDPNMGVII